MLGLSHQEVLDDEHVHLGAEEALVCVFWGANDRLVRNVEARVDDEATAGDCFECLDQSEVARIVLLLDGLDEISDIDKRRAVCEWIDGFAPGLQTARIVVTSRWTGYRKVEGIELGFDHLRADIKDFSSEQQADFLRKWTRAAYLGEVAPADADLSQWEIKQEQQAERQAEKIIAFLEEEKNRAVRDLAAVPMLLQIIAVIWKERGLLLQGRSDLFQAAVNYLLDFRDRKRKLDPLLSRATRDGCCNQPPGGCSRR